MFLIKEDIMKKIIFVILAAVLITGAFAACANGSQDGEQQPQTQNIKAIIQTVSESSLMVQPLEGLDGIDIISLNMNSDTVLNVSDGAPLEPGTIVYAVIGTEIMESYPPQVFLYEITKTEIDPDITLAPQDDTQLAPENYLTGKVTAIDGDQYTITVIGSNVYEGQVTITIPQEVLSADMPIVEGYLIGVYFEIGSDPILAQKLVFSEEDTVIVLDDRETVSGYLGGEFPQAIYSMSDGHIDAQAGVMFAIGLEQNCESTWTLTEQENVELVASGDAPPCDDGTYLNYFGVRISKPGSYSLVFINETADGNFDFSFDVTVTE